MAANVLDICNDMLLNVGADGLSTIGNNRQGTVVARCLRDAVTEICSHHHWSWMKAVINAESWQDEVATISTNAIDVLMVRTNNWVIPRVDDNTFYSNALANYNFVAGYTEGMGGRPMQYAKVGHRSFSFAPHPVDTVTRNEILFHVRMIPFITLTDDFEPEIPFDILGLVRYYGSGLLALKLTGEAQLSGSFMQLYQQNLSQVRARYSMENSSNQSGIA